MAEHMDIESKLHHLTGLAREKSSERRRALLREVTDLFFADGPDGGTILSIKIRLTTAREAIIAAAASAPAHSGPPPDAA